MTNYLIFPDLYEGSALTDISLKLEKEILNQKIDVKIIKFDGEIKKLKNGKLDDPLIFLNHNLVVLNKLKASLEEGDKILFIDFMQLGLGLLRYFLDGQCKKVKFGSLFHGASFVKGDYFENCSWMKNFDKGLIDLMDSIYVPSNYTSSFFEKSARNKIKTFSFEFNPNSFHCNLEEDKKYDVIIPHRWSWEKNPKFYRDLIKSLPYVNFAISGFGEFSEDEKLKKLFKEIISLKNVTNIGALTGKEFYQELENSKIVLGTQDTFGYSLREAISCGCIPLAIKDYCYPDFLDEKYLFTSLEESKKKIILFLQNYPNDYFKLKSTTFKEILEDFYKNE